MDDRTKLDKLSEAVYDEAVKEAAGIRGQAARESEELLRAAAEGLKAEIAAMTENRKAKKKNETNTGAAVYAISSQKKLVAERDALAGEVFGDAERMIREYTKSAEYPAKLAELCGRAREIVGGVTLLRAAPADIAMVEAAAPGVKVAADPDIKLGGIVAEGGRLAADLTFDGKLRGERESFAARGVMLL